MPMIVPFDPDSSELRPIDREIISEMAATFHTRLDIRIVRVEGHADTCDHARAAELSRARAEAVATVLVETHIPARAIEIVSYSPDRYESGRCEGPDDDPSNRRVEFSVFVRLCEEPSAL